MDEARALELAAALGERVWGFKVNDLLIQSGLGVVRKLKKFGNVFADPKLHDIPNTVANGVKELAAAGADLITVHASGGSEMLKAAAKAAQNSKILAVTVLTSFNDAAAKEVFGQDTRSTVTRFARLASASGVHGLVSSPQELELLADLTDLLKVTPGVRPASYAKSDDQARTMTPREAFEKGATHLVIGRPITGEKDPIGAMDKIEAEL
jgi:orotidine-5'-phosphate decarboxylase